MKNDDVKAIRSFADFKEWYAVPSDRHEHGICNDDDDSAIGIVLQVHEASTHPQVADRHRRME